MNQKTIQDATKKPTRRRPDVPQGIDDPETSFILIQQGTAVAVNSKTGKIVGAHAEGTLGIVIYGGDNKDIEGDRFKVARAVRVPRLLQSDILLNFHVAEINYHEGRQAARFAPDPFLLGATGFYRLEHANPFTKIPDDPDDNPCFIGFYLSPLSDYELCLVSKARVWPDEFGKYLAHQGLTPKQLFEEISAQSESVDVKIFSSLLFLPDRRGLDEDPEDHKFGLKVLDRQGLDLERAKRDVGGWWFNIPVAIYPWMTANLERLLAAYLSEAKSTTSRPATASLGGWKLHAWFKLLSNLTQGLKALHRAGAIHGDPRPANIMTHIAGPTEIEPANFSWIDIGLGYGARDVIDGEPPLQENQTNLTPRPLGGGRSTIFYAPEREEAQEFEDADVISLEACDGEPHLSKLTFYWRAQTHLQKTETLMLKDDKNASIRELGELTKGDRIQVREFLFEVERVEADHIIVSGIYEVFLDRVLVEKKADKRQDVRDRLGYASISRYRIFKQWSQATDIYGLGMITLYLFFTRGLYAFMQDVDANAGDEDPSLGKTSVYDRANREKIFSELAVLLRNRSFLENVLYALKSEAQSLSDQNQPRLSGLEQNPEYTSSLKSEAHESSEDTERSAAQATETKVSNVIVSTDTNFELIRIGLNGDHELFAQLIYFCLSCVWREDEVTEIVNRGGFDFHPFCKSRLMIEAELEQAEPAEKAYAMLESLLPLIGAADDLKPDAIPKGTFRALGVAREEQIITLREDLRTADQKLRAADKKLWAADDNIRAADERMVATDEKLQRIVVARDELKRDVELCFRKIQESAKSMSQEIKESPMLWRHKKKSAVTTELEGLGEIAGKGADLCDDDDEDEET